MLWILFALSSIFACVYFWEIIGAMFSHVRDKRKIRNKAIRMGILIVGIVVASYGIKGIGTLSYEEVVETNWELVSLSEKSQVSGKGSGELVYIESSDAHDEYLFFYKINNKGGFKQGKIDVDVTTIYEMDNCKPHVVEYTKYTRNKMNNTLRIILALGYGASSQKSYEIYIPKGTICLNPQ